MKKSVFLFAFLLGGAVSFGYAQTTSEEFDDYYPSDSSLLKEKKTSFGMELGTSISSNFKGATAFSTYMAPWVNYQLSDRWSMQVGTMIVNSQLDGFNHPAFSDRNGRSHNLTNQFVFGQLNYQASEDVVLFGSVSQQVLTLQPSLTGSSTNLSNSTSYSLGMEYKVSKNFSLGVEVRQSRGGNPYNPYQPFGRYGSSFFSNGGYFGPGSFGR